MEIVSLQAQPDTAAIHRLLDRGQYLRGAAPDSAGWYGREALVRSRKAGYIQGEVKGLILSCYPLLVGGKFAEAEKVCTEARDLAQAHRLHPELATAWNNLGICYMNTGRTERAFEALIEAAKAFGHAHQPAMQAKVLGNLGSSLMMTGLDQRARPYLTEAWQISLQQRDTLSAAHFLLNLSLADKHLGDTAAALRHTQEVYQTGHRYQNLELIYGAAINLADHALAAGDAREAFAYWTEAYDKAVQMGSPDKTALPLYGQADYYLRIGNVRKAIALLTQSVALGEASGEKVRLRNAYKRMAEAQRAAGNNDAAYTYLAKFQALDEQLRSAEVQKNIHELETRYQTERKERLLVQQRLQLSEQRQTLHNTYWLLTLGLGLAVSAGLLMRSRFRQRQALARQELSALQARQEALRLEALMQGEERERNRVAQELHDGIGGLLAATKYRLSGLPDQDGLPQAMALLDEAARETRAISHQLLPAQLLRSGIVASLQAFCSDLAAAGRLAVAFTALGDAAPLPAGKTELALFRIAQELIGNALRHAHARELLVQLSISPDGYLLTVEDDGQGFDPHLLGQADGIGLQNLRQRAALFGGSITWQTTPGQGTSAEVHLPFAP